MKTALVHDWIAGIAGDVRVLHALQQMYPDADTFCLSDGKPSRFRLLLMPMRVESLDLSSYDLVISTGSIFSKGLILRPRTIHINYCHSPTRQVWDLSHEYRYKLFQHGLRIWDRNASTRVDHFIANSEHVKKRIKKYYHRDATVIYPPVTISPQPPLIYKRGSEGEFLIISRLFRHKNIDVAIRAFNKLSWELTIVGDGPERARLEALAGPTVHLLGSLPDASCSMLYASCSAFIMPQEEDFGISAIEALSHGKPVLALRRGGALEYIQEGINGLFFDSPHEAILADGVRRLRETHFNPEQIKATAQPFSCQTFQSSFSSLINQIGR